MIAVRMHCKEIKISREDLENLDIRTIINSYENLEFEKLKNIINKSISINKSNYYKNQYSDSWRTNK